MPIIEIAIILCLLLALAGCVGMWWALHKMAVTTRKLLQELEKRLHKIEEQKQ